jgi:hypothetical protein
MDPNATLEEMLRLATDIQGQEDNAPEDAENFIDSTDAARLAELVISLDHWIQNGGFLPKDWRR